MMLGLGRQQPSMCWLGWRGGMPCIWPAREGAGGIAQRVRGSQVPRRFAAEHTCWSCGQMRGREGWGAAWAWALGGTRAWGQGGRDGAVNSPCTHHQLQCAHLHSMSASSLHCYVDPRSIYEQSTANPAA